MSKLKDLLTKVKERVKAAFKSFPFIPAFIGGMIGVVLFAHFAPSPGKQEVSAALVPPVVVAQAPEPVQKPFVEAVRYPDSPAKATRVFTPRTQVVSGAQTTNEKPQTIIVEIHQMPAPEPVPPVAPKEMPEHLKLTPENIARVQNINRADGATDEFDIDFDQEPEKEVKK